MKQKKTVKFGEFARRAGISDKKLILQLDKFQLLAVYAGLTVTEKGNSGLHSENQMMGI
jgi:hypothetical protein